MRKQLVWLTYTLTLFLLAAGQAQAQGPNHHRIGLNVGSQDDYNRSIKVANESAAIGVGTVRMDVRPVSYSEQHYSDVVDEFAIRGIKVLIVFATDNFSPSHNQAHFYERTPWAICNHYYPTAWGNSHVDRYLDHIDSYIDALKDKSNVVGFEIWNEVTNLRNHLCPADYAAMITKAKWRWPGEDFGTSTESSHDSAYAWQFIQKLYDNTYYVDYYRAYNSGPPWHAVMHHPYSPYKDDNSVEYHLWYQGDKMKSVQPREVWFTELGWKLGNAWNEVTLSEQDYLMGFTIDKIIDNNFADRVFWFQMFNCPDETGDFGLKYHCHGYEDNPNDRRPAWWTLENRLNWK